MQSFFIKYKSILNISILSILFIFLFFCRVVLTHEFKYVFLFWNIFLGILPVVFLTVTKFVQNKYLKLFVWIIIVLFLPNTIYVFTDFIHIGTFFDKSYELLYFDLTLIMVAVIISLFSYGYVIKYLKTILNKLFNKYYTLCIVFIINMSLGYAVYLGRVLRLNSWDILNPLKLLENIIYGFQIDFLLIILFIFAWSIIFTLYSYE